MEQLRCKARFVLAALLVPALWLCAGGCGSLEANIVLGAVGGTGLLAQAPGHEIQQVYYLGVFDPHSQAPTEIYTLSLHDALPIFNNVLIITGT